VSATHEKRPLSGILGWSLALGLTAGTLPAASAWAQAGIDMDDGTRTAAPPIAAPPIAAPPIVAPHDTIQDGVHYSLHSNDPAQDTVLPPATTSTDLSAPPVAGPAVADLPEPVNLEHPKVLDTAKLSGNGTIVSLFGIVGQTGEPAQKLESYLASADMHLTCPAQTSTDYVCLLPDGTDIAAVALVNGAARTRDDAPDAYRAQEAEARANRRGLWANLPLPPDAIVHPTVQDTATLVSGYQRFVLDGLIGLRQPYAAQLQGYIAANGDRLTCQAQAMPGHYICMLDDGTDIAKVALVNGAARIAADAPDSYRAEQLAALNNRRGLWANPQSNAVMASVAAPPPSACCAYVAGDDGSDGIRYVGGEPTANIGGATVFLILAGAAGWGYYDRTHGWHDAPFGYRSHMERFHPNGMGLRAYRSVIVPNSVATIPAGRFPSTGTVYQGAARPGPAAFATHSSVGSFRPHAGSFNPPARTGGFVRPAATATPFRPAGLSAAHVATSYPAVPADPRVRRR
jgi:endonuclease YncB( thermonuclease family)